MSARLRTQPAKVAVAPTSVARPARRRLVRLGSPDSQASDLDRLGKWIETAAMILYVALLYKLAMPGVLAMAALTLALLMMRSYSWRIAWMIPGLAVAYVFMATITAFAVDFDSGVERTLQFGLAVGAAGAIAKYLQVAEPARKERFLQRFFILNIVILTHLIVHHIANGHLVTWKYLYDTKFTLSSIVIILFFSEDALRRRGRSKWYAALAVVSVIVLLSGERKAYILMVLAFLLSREAIIGKLLICGSAALAILAFAVAQPGAYIARQALGSSTDYSRVSNRYFFAQAADLADHSDAIRAFTNRNATELFRRQPILGVGSTGYVAWARMTYGPPSPANGLSMNVHGELHRVPAESGIVGISIALAFLAGCTVAAVKSFRTSAMASARDRTPAYILIFLLCYLSSEALDTTMLLMILLAGALAGAILARSVSGRALLRPAERLRRLAV